MSSYLALLFVRRTLVLGLLGMVLSGGFVAIRNGAQLQALSSELLLAFFWVQLPHVVYVAGGLAAYWVVDQLGRQGQWELLTSSGVSPSRLTRPVVLAAISLTVMMAAVNTTLVRRASENLSSLRAVMEVAHLATELSRRPAFRLGRFHLTVDSIERQDGGWLLRRPLVALREVVLEPGEAELGRQGIRCGPSQLKVLDPWIEGSVGGAHIAFPPPASSAVVDQLERFPVLTSRALAWAIDVWLFVLLALVCARRGQSGRRGQWFLGWLVLGVTPVLLAQNSITELLRGSRGFQLLWIPALPLVLGVIVAASLWLGRRRWG